jgi:hypothetical protein
MSIRELIALVSKEFEPRRVSHSSTVRAHPRLEALETRMAPSGTGTDITPTPDPSLPPPTQTG